MKNRKNRKKIGLILIIFIIISLVFTIAKMKEKEKNIGDFKSEQQKNAYMSAYDEVMKQIDNPDKIYDIETKFGKVRVYKWGNSDGIPVLLLPGHSSGTPMWVYNIPNLAENNIVYALDALGDAGKSQQTNPFNGIEDVTAYLYEVINYLEIEKVNIVGHSFGGGTASNFATEYPQKVNTLTLLEPAFAINYPTISVMFWATVSSLEFLPDSWQNYGLSKISGEKIEEIKFDTDPLATMIKVASSGYSNSLPTPKTLDKNDLMNLEMPVYIGLSKDSLITKGAEKNANLIPKVTIRVWDNTTHSLPMQVVDKLTEDLNKFWNDNN